MKCDFGNLYAAMQFAIFGTTLALSRHWGVTAQVTQAIQLSDGTVYFVQPPDLVEATTTFNSVQEWGATYYFTINYPRGRRAPPAGNYYPAGGRRPSASNSKTAAPL